MAAVTLAPAARSGPVFTEKVADFTRRHLIVAQSVLRED
jgi:hypothetical protein